MKRLLLIFSIVFPFLGLAQILPKAKTDSVKISAQQLELTLKKLEGSTKLNNSLSRENRKLNGDLLKYVAQENFYATALDRQATHYEFLLAFIVGGAGLISYAFINRRFTQLNNLFQNEIRRLSIDLSNSITESDQKIKEGREELIALQVLVQIEATSHRLSKASIHRKNDDLYRSLKELFNSISSLLNLFEIIQTHSAYFEKYKSSLLTQLSDALESGILMFDSLKLLEELDDERFLKFKADLNSENYDFFQYSLIDRMVKTGSLNVILLSSQLKERIESFKNNV
ncbi:hypothetical protein ACO2Q8_08465 [Larkinella sp. VNQ87]|uniref:hypothetical protein n=1 Tax=Larkinella sp. VNQ87 TaxID=3400921 RepID=UPI003C069CD1